MCILFSILEEIVIEALILSCCGEHIGGYANRQLLAEVWKMAFKILVPVQIRAALLSSGVVFSYHHFIPPPQAFHTRALLWFGVWSDMADREVSRVQPGSKFLNAPTFAYF